MKTQATLWAGHIIEQRRFAAICRLLTLYQEGEKICDSAGREDKEIHMH